MKIKIKTRDFRLALYLPASLVLSNFGISVMLYAGRKYVRTTKTEKRIIADQMKKCKKQWKGLTLVDVKTSDGEEILITL